VVVEGLLTPSSRTTISFCAGPGKASNHVEWELEKISFANTVLAFPAFFIV
jgi:hypothetical protein